MAFKQERPGIWYDREAEGTAILKVAWEQSGAFAKAVTADGVFTRIDARTARALLAPPVVVSGPTVITDRVVTTVSSTSLCSATTGSGCICGRALPCRYHG